MGFILLYSVFFRFEIFKFLFCKSSFFVTVQQFCALATLNVRKVTSLCYQVFLMYKSPVRSARIQPIGIAIQIPVSPRNVSEST